MLESTQVGRQIGCGLEPEIAVLLQGLTDDLLHLGSDLGVDPSHRDRLFVQNRVENGDG